MRSIVRVFSGALTSLFIAWPAYAARPDDPIRLVYTLSPAAAQCPPEEQFRQEVAKRIGHDPFTDDAARSLAITIERRGGQFVAAGEMTGDGAAVLWDPPLHAWDCKALVSLLGSAVALELTPILMPEEPEEPPPAAPMPPASASVPTACPEPSPPSPIVPARPMPHPAPLERPRAPSRPRLELGAGVFVALLRTPAPGPGVAISAGVRWSFFSIALDGRAVLPVIPYEVEGEAGRRADIRSSLVTSSMAPCTHVGAVFACVPFEFGLRTVSSPPGVTIDREQNLFFGLGMRAGVELSIGRGFYLRGAVDAIGTLHAGPLRVDGPIWWTPPPLSILAGGSVVAAF